jgi:Protein of unknown function (DUF3040)
MTVFPDGDALSDWELEILEDIERDIEVSDPWLAAFLFRGDPAPVHVLAAYVVAAEAALALAALTVSAAYTMAGLATIGTSLWATSLHAAQGLRPAPGLLGQPAND